MLVKWALEQRASPSLLADSLGALNHSLRFSRSRPLPSCFRMHLEVNHRVYSALRSRSEMPWLVDSQQLTCLSHFSALDVRALVRRVVELTKIIDVACCSEHHQLLMVLIILSQLCFDSNHNVRLSVFGCNCERLRSRWSRMASECVGRPTSCCCNATDTLASCARSHTMIIRF